MRAKGLRFRLCMAVLALAGVATLVYPSAASWFTDREQATVVRGYAKDMSSLPAAVLARERASAERYNQSLVGSSTPMHDPFTASTQALADTNSVAVREYLKQLSPIAGQPMASLSIPRLNSTLPIYHGTSNATLERGIGHLFGTSLPIGGASTHAVLTGHRGYPESTLFTHLDKMRLGDVFTVSALGKTLAYQVDQIKVVLPSNTKSLGIVPGRDLVTLITCTPIGINSHRLLVQAHRVPYHAAPAAVDPAAIVGFPWWALALASTAAVGAWYAFGLAKPKSRTRRQPLRSD